MKFETKYKKYNYDQLDLTHTAVAVPADLVEFETRVLDLWQDLNLVELLQEKRKDSPTYSFFDGPVTANNPLGVHHAWGRTLKDAVLRFHALAGFQQRLQYGFDTQGLWVEVEVEKSLNFQSKRDLEEYGVDRFVNACKERVEQYSKVQDTQSLRLGMLKSSESYFTHHDRNVSAIWQFLSKAQTNGWLYKGHRPMPWCVRCGTSLSSHEQADSYKEVEHTTVYAKFPVDDWPYTYFVVWTTTPWTLPANLSIAVHPDFDYGLFQSNNGEYYVVGLWLQNTLMKDMELVRVVKGHELCNWTYTTAFSDLENQQQSNYAVVPWTEVTKEEGTGVVHLAPGCGQEDFVLLQDHSLTPLSPLDEYGVYKSGYGTLSGKFYTDVNQQVVHLLDQRHLLFSTEGYTHRYPHCWRCKTELVYRLVDEWFLSMDELRPQLLAAADEVVWNPEYTKKLFTDWLNNMGDWCISRKRYWGLPLPFYECSCGHLTVVSSKELFLSKAVGPVDQVEELHLPWVDQVQFPCEQCGQPVDRVSEVGDCWLDAGVMPFSTLDYFTDPGQWQTWFPAEFVCEMREQVRLWFYSLMVLSVTLVGQPPFKAVLSYEQVRDRHNQEMHKSGKNNVHLDDALKKLGADTLRLYYLSQNRSSNMRFDFDVGVSYFKLLRRLLHSFKFFQTYANLEQFRFDPKFEAVDMHDRWMLSRLADYTKQFQGFMENFDFPAVVVMLDQLVDDLSSWYLRRVRDRVWQKTTRDDAVYHTLFVVFRQVAVLFASVTPFTAELLYQNLRLFGELELSVHLEDLENQDLQNYFDSDLEATVARFQLYDNLNRTLRNEVSVKMRQPLSTAYLWDSQYQNLVTTHLFLLEDLFNVKHVEFVSDPSELIKFGLKPKYKLLGPKLGAQLQALDQALKDLSSDTVATFVLGDQPQLQVAEFSVDRDELEVVLLPRAGLSLKSDHGAFLLLDLRLTADLEMEGWLNDFSRHVQVLRSELDLAVEQRVKLYVSGDLPLVEYLNRSYPSLADSLYLSNLTLAKTKSMKPFQHELGTVSYQLVV